MTTLSKDDLKAVAELTLEIGQVAGQRDEARRQLEQDRQETNRLLREIRDQLAPLPGLLAAIERNTRR